MANTKKKGAGGFEENYKLLEELSQELQENKVGVDQLVPRMKEALEAIKVCKSVLKETSAQLIEINKEFEELEELASEEQV
jgi:exodeoxyribonuclease VII small subunit